MLIVLDWYNDQILYKIIKQKKFIKYTYPNLFKELESIGPLIFIDSIVFGTFIKNPKDYGWYVLNSKTDKLELLKYVDALDCLISPIKRTDFEILEEIIEF